MPHDSKALQLQTLRATRRALSVTTPRFLGTMPPPYSSYPLALADSEGVAADNDFGGDEARQLGNLVFGQRREVLVRRQRRIGDGEGQLMPKLERHGGCGRWAVRGPSRTSCASASCSGVGEGLKGLNDSL